MTSSSHLASSALCYLAAASWSETPAAIEGLVITAAGSLLPDIDTPTSSVGRPLFPLARWIDRRFGHRTLTHSLVGLAGLAAVLFAVALIVDLCGWSPGVPLRRYAFFLTLGYASHILVDCLNKTGVELVWPSKWRCVFFYNSRYRITAAGKGDTWFMAACLVLDLAAYPLARDGLTRSLHQAFGDIYSVSMDFKQYGDKNRIWLDLEGVEAISNQKIRGRFEILAAVDNAAVLVERDGRKQIVSRTEPLEIYPDSARISIGEAVAITTQEINMAGRTLAEIPRFLGADRVLFYGYVTPVRHTLVSVHQGRYNPIALRMDKLKLEHAEWRDIQEQGLEQVAIREGTLMAKVYRSGLNPAVDSLAPPVAPAVESVEIRFQPTDAILFRQGDVIRQGQVIGRRDITLELANLRAECAREVERLREEIREVELRLTSARDQLRLAEKEKVEREREIDQFRGTELFSKEVSRLREAADRQVARIQSEQDSLALLEQRRRELEQRVSLRAERLRQDETSVIKRAGLVASFSGKVMRIEQRAEGEMILFSVLYR
ncbi:MAG: metal-dependent hydrolase [Acidobacteriota bacterium]